MVLITKGPIFLVSKRSWQPDKSEEQLSVSCKFTTECIDLPYAALIRFTRYWMVLCVGLFLSKMALLVTC